MHIYGYICVMTPLTVIHKMRIKLNAILKHEYTQKYININLTFFLLPQQDTLCQFFYLCHDFMGKDHINIWTVISREPSKLRGSVSSYFLLCWVSNINSSKHKRKLDGIITKNPQHVIFSRAPIPESFAGCHGNRLVFSRIY